MKQIIYVLVAVVLLTISFQVFKFRPTVAYAVRENVNPTPSSISWDLWCWKEDAHHKIKKTFIGHFMLEGATSTGDRINTSLCTN